MHCTKSLTCFRLKTAATLAHLTDVGFLWFREFYLETSRVIQVGIDYFSLLFKIPSLFSPMAWYDIVWYGMTWHGMVWYCMVWYGMVWHSMVWYGWDFMVWCFIRWLFYCYILMLCLLLFGRMCGAVPNWVFAALDASGTCVAVAWCGAIGDCSHALWYLQWCRRLCIACPQTTLPIWWDWSWG